MPKYMMIIKGSENAPKVPPALYEAVDQLLKEAGDTLVGFGGLAPTKNGARVRVTGGKVTVKDGPFTESKEIIGGFATFELPSLEAAKKWNEKFVDVHNKHYPGWDFEVEIRLMADG